MERAASKGNVFNIQYIARIAILSALAAILFILLVPPVPLFAPWLTIDFSDIPALIAGFSMGPVAGVLVELIKIVFKIILKPDFATPVGEIANFLVGCAFIIPATLIYNRNRSMKSAIIGLATGFLAFVGLAAVMNWLVIIPVFAILLSGKPLSILFTNSPSEVYNLIITGQSGIFADAAANGYTAISSLSNYILYACIPFNAIKGAVIALVTALLYKRLSPLLKPKVR